MGARLRLPLADGLLQLDLVRRQIHMRAVRTAVARRPTLTLLVLAVAHPRLELGVLQVARRLDGLGQVAKHLDGVEVAAVAKHRDGVVLELEDGHLLSLMVVEMEARRQRGLGLGLDPVLAADLEEGKRPTHMALDHLVGVRPRRRTMNQEVPDTVAANWEHLHLMADLHLVYILRLHLLYLLKILIPHLHPTALLHLSPPPLLSRLLHLAV